MARDLWETIQPVVLFYSLRTIRHADESNLTFVMHLSKHDMDFNAQSLTFRWDLKLFFIVCWNTYVIDIEIITPCYELSYRFSDSILQFDQNTCTIVWDVEILVMKHIWSISRESNSCIRRNTQFVCFWFATHSLIIVTMRAMHTINLFFQCWKKVKSSSICTGM